jgi:hypothetical protein
VRVCQRPQPDAPGVESQLLLVLRLVEPTEQEDGIVAPIAHLGLDHIGGGDNGDRELWIFDLRGP